MISSKTVLVVSYHFPPEESSCSEKNIRIVKLLHDSGYRVIVLTKSGYTDLFSGLEGVHILRTHTDGLFHKHSKEDCSINSIHVPSRKSVLASIKNKISSLVIPDGTIDWLFPAMRLIRQNHVLLKQCDIILSISSPYSAHFVSRYASRRLARPYIMAYGDPWIYEPKRKRRRLRYSIEKLLEGRLLNDSSKVLLITDWNKKRYEQLYDLPEAKVMTYHIGYDKSDTLDIEIPHHDHFRILYGGSLDPIHRNPEPFMAAMHNTGSIEAHIYCNDNPLIPELIHEYNLKDRVFHHPLIKTSDFNRLMYDFDALLLFGNKTPFQVPGKVFTYIATRKTIIYIKNNEFEDDGTEAVLREYGNCVIVKNDPEQIRYFLNQILSLRTNKPTSPSIQFEFHNTLKPIVLAIESVLANE